MELKRFPRYVRKYLVFHDPQSFKTVDEALEVKAVGFPEDQHRPIGLHVVIREFLLAHPEWIEEMSFIHNNGFLVLRRKEVPPGDLKVRRPSLRIDEGAKPVSMDESLTATAQAVCTEKYKALHATLNMDPDKVTGTQPDPPCHEARGFTVGTDYTVRYNNLITQEDLPHAPLLPLILGHIVATMQGSARRVHFYGCDVYVLVAVAHGLAWSSGRGTASHPAALPCEDLPKHFGHIAWGSELNAADSVDLIVASAKFLSAASEGELQALATAAKHRIVVYGHSVHDVSAAERLLSRSNFELKTALSQTIGLAMWEKKDRTELLYVPEAKRW
jgi:hypothetical protein